jgi:hypothetical protein
VIPLLLDMCSAQKVLKSFIAKRNVEGMLVAFIDVTKTSGMFLFTTSMWLTCFAGQLKLL